MNNSIYPCIWCNNNAREMADYYCGIFPETRISEENPLVVMLEMFGQKIMLLNGGDIYKPNMTISLMFMAMVESEVEEIWDSLIQGGESIMALDAYPFSRKYGWVQDKYNVSWQLYTARAPSHIIQKVVPTLMFTGAVNGRATEAAQLYTSLFPHSEMRGMMHYDPSSGEPATNVQHGEFMINDYLLMMMDSSLEFDFTFSEGMSIIVECNYQEEIDDYWSILTFNGGEESRCGWLKDQFGISWQLVPTQLDEWMSKSPKVMEELMKMNKPDLNLLKEAAETVNQ